MARGGSVVTGPVYRSGAGPRQEKPPVGLSFFGAVIAGNIIEYFDFLLFAHFSFILTPLFFETEDPVLNRMISLGLFSVGFLARPLGGLWLGWMGDRQGRVRALSRSVLWMVGPTVVMGLMPTVQQAGPVASVLVVLCRIVQGMSLGGEYATAGVFLMEHTPVHRRGFLSGCLVASGSVGSLAGLGCVWCVVSTGSLAQGWRVPFLMSALLGMLAFRMRRALAESPDYMVFRSRQTQTPHAPARARSGLALLATAGMAALSTLLVWIPVTWTNVWMTQTVGWTSGAVMPFVLLAIVIYILVAPLAGLWGDKLGHVRLMRLSALGAFLAGWPLFYCFAQGYLGVSQTGFSVLAALFGACIHPVFAALYPPERRCLSVGLGLSLGAAVGGSAPLVSAWLVEATRQPTSPALLVMLVASAAFGATFCAARPWQER